jgi:hypothetical protein
MKKAVAVVATGLAMWMALPAPSAADGLQADPAGSKDLVTRERISWGLKTGVAAMDVPWPLDPDEIEITPDIEATVARVRIAEHEEDGVYVSVTVTTFKEGVTLDLEGVVEGAVDELQRVPGTQSVDGRKRRPLFWTCRPSSSRLGSSARGRAHRPCGGCASLWRGSCTR